MMKMIHAGAGFVLGADFVLGSRFVSESHSVSGQQLWQWRQEAKQQAQVGGVPLTEVDWLLQAVAGLDRLSLRLDLFRDRAEILLPCSLEALTCLWQQRLEERVPVQYLVGTTPWRKFQLAVSPAVLIPRPETECLIDLAMNVVQQHPELAEGDWADLGTGSGAIAIGLAEALPQATIHAVDASLDALAIAETNAQQLGWGDRIQFYQGNWFAPLSLLQGKLKGMVSNPPYIPTAMLVDLQPEVAKHEPHQALDGGADGLDCIRHLVTTAPMYLCAGGSWMIEMMAGQANTVAELLHQQGCYQNIQIHPDLAGIDRFVLAHRI